MNSTVCNTSLNFEPVIENSHQNLNCCYVEYSKRLTMLLGSYRNDLKPLIRCLGTHGGIADLTLRKLELQIFKCQLSIVNYNFDCHHELIIKVVKDCDFLRIYFCTYLFFG